MAIIDYLKKKYNQAKYGFTEALVNPKSQFGKRLGTAIDTDAARLVRGLPQANLTQYANRIQNPITRTAVKVPTYLAQEIINAVPRSLTAGGRLGQDIAFERPTSQKLAHLAGAAELPFTIATFGAGGQLAKEAGKQTLKQTLKVAAQQGAKYGAGFGGLMGVAGQEQAKKYSDLVKAGLIGAGTGAGLGAVAGPATVLAGKGAGYVAKAVQGKLHIERNFRLINAPIPMEEGLATGATVEGKTVRIPQPIKTNSEKMSNAEYLFQVKHDFNPPKGAVKIDSYKVPRGSVTVIKNAATGERVSVRPDNPQFTAFLGQEGLGLGLSTKNVPGEPIPSELEPLAQEARKYKSAEEFVGAMKGVASGKLEPPIGVYPLSIDKQLRGAGFIPKKENPTQYLTDFYRQATKGGEKSIQTFNEWLTKFPPEAQSYGRDAEDGYALYLQQKLGKTPTVAEVKKYGGIKTLTTDTWGGKIPESYGRGQATQGAKKTKSLTELLVGPAAEPSNDVRLALRRSYFTDEARLGQKGKAGEAVIEAVNKELASTPELAGLPPLRKSGTFGQAKKILQLIDSRATQGATGGAGKGKIQAVETSQVRQRGFVTTVKESPKTSKAVAAQVEGLYQVRNTQELGQKAQNLVKEYPETALQIVKSGKTDDQTVATAIELMGKYGREGNHTLEAEIANNLAPRLTEAGRTAQAASLYNRMTPEGVVRWAASEINKANQSNPKLNLVLKPEDAARLREVALRIQKLTNPEEKAIANMFLADEIGKLVPSTRAQQAVVIWKAGLLTGLKTTGVNISSNIVHGAAEVVKDIPGSAVDSVASLFTGQRTKTFTVRGTGTGIREGFSKGWRYLRTGYDERNVAAKYDYTKVNFGNSRFSKILQGYEEGIFRLMGAEDQPFYYGAKSRSLYDQAYAAAKNKGLRGEAITQFVDNFVKKPTDQALQFAVNDAEMAVFQNQTLLGKVAKGLGKNPVGEVIAPFRRTPSAVATQLVNYSPVGIVKAIVENVGKGKFDQRAFSQLMGRGITGTALFTVGAYLMKNGLMTLNAPTSEKERNQWELEGKQPNSIRVGDRNYQAGSFGPVGLSLLVGGYYQRALAETGSYSNALASLGTGIARSVLDQSFLQGLSGLLNAFNDPQRYAGTYISRTLGSVIPTLVSDVARGTDTYERQTKGSVLQPLQSRIPGIRQGLTPRQDVLGQPIQTPGLTRSLVDFTRSTQAKTSPVTQEFGATGTTPTKFDDTIKVLKQEIKLNEKELYQLNQETGGQINQVIDTVIKTPAYQQLDQEDKQAVIDRAVQGVKDNAKMSLVAGGRGLTGNVTTDALLEVAKYKFKQSGKNIEQVGDLVLRRDKDGSVTVMSQLSYDSAVTTNKMQKAKLADNYQEWLKLAEEQLTNLQQQLQDPSLDELEQSDVNEKIDKVLSDAEKYAEYGGKFKKGKKPKQPRSPIAPSLKLSAVSGKGPKSPGKPKQISLAPLKLGGTSVKPKRGLSRKGKTPRRNLSLYKPEVRA